MKLFSDQRITEFRCHSFEKASNWPVFLPLRPIAGFYFVIMALGLLAFNIGNAMAQSKCGDRTSIARTLSNKFSEAPVANGLTKDGAVIEVIASVSGSWTMILTLPTGESCFLAAGESWENLPVLTMESSI